MSQEYIDLNPWLAAAAEKMLPDETPTGEMTVWKTRYLPTVHLDARNPEDSALARFIFTLDATAPDKRVARARELFAQMDPALQARVRETHVTDGYKEIELAKMDEVCPEMAEMKREIRARVEAEMDFLMEVDKHYDSSVSPGARSQTHYIPEEWR